MKLSLLIICTIPGKWWCAVPFSPPPNNLPILTASICDAPSTKLFSSAKDEPSGSSDGLRSLLPTAKKRTLQLDKFGRRVHDLTDDGTTQYSKGNVYVGPATDAAPMKSDHDITAQLSEVEATEASESPSLSKILASNQNEDLVISPTTNTASSLKSPKELAAIASSADFGKKISKSADLKALLPTQKMRFMKLDKFGRRVQRMEDDGTVNMMKEPQQKKQQEEEVSEPPIKQQQQQDQQQMPVRSYRGTKDGFSSDINAAATAAATPPPASKKEEAPIKQSQSLSDILGTKEDRPSLYDAMLVGEGDYSVDLKELLPKQKMRFMKLDKFGRRVQQMEDDGTVNMKKEPSATAVTPSSSGNSKKESAAVLDLGSNLESGAANYGSLKDLLPTRRATWTKLDFKGGSVPDERRVMKDEVQDTVENTDNAGGSLKELLPKRATWTKLDFKGGSVEDTRRTKKRDTSTGSNSGSGSFNEGQYSNLKTLLPERTITWKKNQVLSSGSAASISSNTVRGLREERQQTMKNEVMASAAKNAISEDNNEENEDEIKPYTNLKDLLPERKFTWRTTRK